MGAWLVKVFVSRMTKEATIGSLTVNSILALASLCTYLTHAPRIGLLQKKRRPS